LPSALSKDETGFAAAPEGPARPALAGAPCSAPALRGGRSALLLATFLVATLLVGALGSLAGSDSVRTWYPTIEKPAWTPPAWLFGPVWTLLYVAMATAAWRVVARDGVLAARLPLALFGLQLALNGAWSWVFFGARAPAAAFVEIVFLWIAVLATTVSFAARSRLAGWLMAPYLAWTTFAAVLNAEIARLAS